MNKDIKELTEIFGVAFPEKTITRVYSECNKNLNEATERLLQLQEQCSSASQSKSRPCTIGKEDQNKSKQNPIENSKKNKNVNLKPSYEKFKSDFQDLLNPKELDSIWNNVRKNCWGNQISVEIHYEMAKEEAEQRILLKFTEETASGDNDSSSGVATTGDSEKSLLPCRTNDFASFIDLFHGLIPQPQLDQIWQSVHTQCINTDQDPKESAVLLALEYLDVQERKPQSKSTTSAKSDENTLLTFLANQELTKSQINSFPQSSRESKLQYLLDLFADSTPVVTPAQISEELIKSNYNISLAIENICDRSLSQRSLSRGLSYAEAVFTGKQASSSFSPQKRTVNSVKSSLPLAARTDAHSSSLAQSTETTGFITIPAQKKPRNPALDCYPLYQRNAHYQNKRWQFAFHFYEVFQRKNPHLFVQLNEDGEFVYEGSQQERKDREFHRSQPVQQRVLQIRMDFHGIPVHHAIELVASSIEYYQQIGLPDPLLKDVVLTFIVGLGLHSPGGVAKLGPAIERFLQQQQRENLRLKIIRCGGEISVQIPRRS